MNEQWQAIVGEVGNEQGHVVGTYGSRESAERAARRAVRAYHGDGWWITRQV